MPVGQRIALERLLTRVAEYKASDLHVTVGTSPVLRVGGKLVQLSDEPIVTPEFMTSFVDELLSDEQKETFRSSKRVMFTYEANPRARFKADIFLQRGYPAASLRYIDAQMPSLDGLGLPSVVGQLARAKKGLIIVSGTLGSGRSTTIAALVNAINQERSEHVITIEQPIEQVFENAKSVIEQRQVGTDTGSFEEALANVYQEDVDVVMVGQMEEPAVMSAALRVAESGRLVITSMNADSAVRTVEKIVTSFPQAEQERVRIQLSETLQGIVCQRLLPRIGGGATVVAEVLVPTRAIRTLIHDGAIPQMTTVIETSREDGMVSLERALADKVQAGQILLDDALASASDQNTLKRMLRPSVS